MAAKKPAPKKGASKSSKKAGAKSSKKFDLEGAIRALSAEAAQTAPILPIPVAILEARRLFKEACKFRPRFQKLPDFNLADLDTLPARTDALDSAQKDWLDARLDKSSSTRSKTGDRTAAEALRSKLMSAGRYLLRKDPKAQAKLDQIAEGEGLADLIQDLKDLADFVEANAKVFESAPNLPKDAAAQARTLAASLTDGVDSAGANDAQARRNQVFAVLESAVDEVRSAARFLFHDDPKALGPMLSHYAADKMRRKRQADGGKAPAPTTPAA
ncbi:MAG: hypothetical protein JST54_00340 [Deltaproteobacteria bacterium]|nr:hypothetical protein [Deltaproteobacteria bacterium]